MPTTHTPGPWHMGAGNGEGSVFADNGRMRLEAGGTTLYPIASVNHGWNAAEDEANARAIAATPELMEACELIAALPLDNFSGCAVGEAIRAARAAIAKATN